jgi:outer membrane protein OmpA-like peptidoglycan-associated protein
MKLIGSLILVACAALVCGCAATAPSELVDARLAYLHASQGPATRLAPVELHKAADALAQAEKSFSKDAKSYHTRDLAYVAQRKAEMAGAQASISAEQTRQAQANSDFQSKQGDILQEKTRDLTQAQTALAISQQSGQATAEKLSAEREARAEADRRTAQQRLLTEEKERDLGQAQTALAVSERGAQATAEQLSAEQRARGEAEEKTAAAMAALAKLTAVKEEERGLVITLSGSVLFRSDESTLMPGARERLDQVADALLTSSNRNVLVEGFTDSQGTGQYNLDLSQRRADAVRSYLVQRGYDPARIQGHGIGEERPVADNATAEGRANNRRVEIVLEREAKL